MEKHTFTCCRCGQTITGTPVMMDDDPLCERCAEEETILCSRCGERIYRDDNAGDENTPLCQPCYMVDKDFDSMPIALNVEDIADTPASVECI